MLFKGHSTFRIGAPFLYPKPTCRGCVFLHSKNLNERLPSPGVLLKEGGLKRDINRRSVINLVVTLKN